MPALSGGMILYRSRSAKSVAWSRLNVIGVSAFFFLPVLVAAFTSADEFHSVMNTGWPAALSHFASSASCVVFPDPSMPSTTNSFPGYSWGVVRLFSIRCAFLVVPSRHFELNRAAEQFFERRRVANRRPQFQFHVFRRTQANPVVFAARQDVDAADRLGMAAVQPLGKAHHRGERAHRPPLRAFQRAVALVRF